VEEHLSVRRDPVRSNTFLSEAVATHEADLIQA